MNSKGIQQSSSISGYNQEIKKRSTKFVDKRAKDKIEDTIRQYNDSSDSLLDPISSQTPVDVSFGRIHAVNPEQ